MDESEERLERSLPEEIRGDLTQAGPNVDEILKRLKKFLPAEIKRNLVRSALFMLAYEMFKDEIVNSVQGFFTMDFVGEDRVYFPDYQTDVLDRHKSEFQACLLWLVEMHVFNSAQVEEISEIREHRNKIAHELLDFLFNPAAQIDLALFDRLRFYLRIVDRFFGQIQVDANSDFDGKDVDPGEIKSITSVFLDIVCQSVASETG